MQALCAGHVNWDVTLRVDNLPAPDGEVTIEEQHQAGGGSAANVAVNLERLNHDASLFGSVGSDESGRFARRELAEAGVETHLVESDGETAVKYLVVDGDGEVMMLSNRGENEAFVAEDLPSEALDVDLLHLTNQPPAVAAALARRGREAGARVSFSPGRRFADRDFSTTLPLADLVFLNELEAAALVEGAGMDALREGARLVVTRGADGAEIRVDGRSYTHEGFHIDPLDTTGAGDAFASGFLAARADGAGYERALAVANACGAVASGAVGARADLSWEAIEALLAEQTA
ncbi:carbohydrate kinase family protein [Halorarum halophilum]|uniref:Carbohydrate kinase family protein n=1 Tax=Halorarum halophilum TaxID=2743090 RepID=A0A7D5GJ28_9EURY|nr:PfkB family carbohydrate kinase [Halobaculum halophilum]QLG26584.1 carbohydrate kinase family protein [Halobaculum halophilum]